MLSWLELFSPPAGRGAAVRDLGPRGVAALSVWRRGEGVRRGVGTGREHRPGPGPGPAARVLNELHTQMGTAQHFTWDLPGANLPVSQLKDFPEIRPCAG